MTRLTDEELRMLQRDVRSDPEVKTPALIVGAIDELLALRAERDMLAAALKRQDAELAQLRGADERAVAIIVQRLADEDFGRPDDTLLRAARWIAANWREWVARDTGDARDE